MKADPRPRSDGTCALPGCRNPLRKPSADMVARSRAILAAELARDPWCSSTCCRIAYGIATPEKAPRVPSVKTPICGENSGYRSGCKCDACLAYVRDTQRRVRERKRAAA